MPGPKSTLKHPKNPMPGLILGLIQIIHLSVGRASARHVGLKPDLQPLDFAMPQWLINYPGLIGFFIRPQILREPHHAIAPGFLGVI